MSSPLVSLYFARKGKSQKLKPGTQTTRPLEPVVSRDVLVCAHFLERPLKVLSVRCLEKTEGQDLCLFDVRSAQISGFPDHYRFLRMFRRD